MIIGPFSAQCLIVEYIRIEGEKRVSLLGTYPMNINVEHRGVEGDGKIALPFGLYVTVQPAPETGTPIHVRLTLNGEELAQIPSTAPEKNEENSALGTMTLAVSGPPLPVNQTSKLEVYLKIGDFEETLVNSLTATLTK
jgi:hypothetical protein